MILQALVQCYEALSADGRLDKPGWLDVKASWSLELDASGQLRRIFPVGTTDQKGRLTGRMMRLPEQAKRTSGVAACFLCNNAAYMLGVNVKENKNRALECYAACAALHLALLKDVQAPMAQAICRFFQQWDAQNAETHPLVSPLLDALKTGGNLVFSMEGVFAQEVTQIR